MADSESEEFPGDVVNRAIDSETTDAFAILGNETRLAILFALWEAYEPGAEENSLSFSALREEVGVRQGAQFNYHLDKLVGRFVRKAEAGYELRRSGLLLVQSIIAGTATTAPDFEPSEIDAECPLCGAATAIVYENVYVYQRCTECEGWTTAEDAHPRGTLVGWTLEPTGLTNRTAREVFAVSTIKTFGRMAMRFEGVCPECSGPVEWTLEICEDHDGGEGERCSQCGRSDAILAREVCTVCKSWGRGSPSLKVIFHPAVVSFFYDRGVEIGFTGGLDFETVRDILALSEEFTEEVVSQAPLRIAVRITHGQDHLELLLDEQMRVVEVSGTESTPDR